MCYSLSSIRQRYSALSVFLRNRYVENVVFCPFLKYNSFKRLLNLEILPWIFHYELSMENLADVSLRFDAEFEDAWSQL
jgi:hypothetical protein